MRDTDLTRTTKNRELLASDDFQQKLAQTLPEVGLTAQRYTRMIASAFTQNPKLWACDKGSIVRSLLFCAQTGLAPTGRGGVHLVPFKVKGVPHVTPIIDYRGAMKIARRSGEILRLDAQIVCENDEFDFEMGATPSLKHKPKLTGRGDIIAVYAVAHLKDAEGLPLFVVLSRNRIDDYRGRSRASGDGPWVTDYDAMAKKTAILRLCNMLPADDDDQRLLALASQADGPDGVMSASFADFDETPVQTPADVRDAEPDPGAPAAAQASGAGEYVDPSTGEVTNLDDAPF